MKNIVIGQKYFRLTIIAQVPSIHKRKRYLAQCECGTKKEYDSDKIGETQSCGCYLKESMSIRNTGKKSPKLIDLTGQVFSRLTVITRDFSFPRRTTWKCKCICGNESIVQSKHLTKGTTLSCGCLTLEINSQLMKGNSYGLKHGLTDHPLRAIRKAMLHRCNNENNRFYKNYGGRGIKVCGEWTNSLESFIAWALQNGWVKGLSLDRIDNDGNYCPDNCHWITIKENSSKKRSPEVQPRKNSDRNKPSSQIQAS